MKRVYAALPGNLGTKVRNLLAPFFYVANERSDRRGDDLRSTA
jgi:hypothetical protein